MGARQEVVGVMQKVLVLPLLAIGGVTNNTIFQVRMFLLHFQTCLSKHVRTQILVACCQIYGKGTSLFGAGTTSDPVMTPVMYTFYKKDFTRDTTGRPTD